MTDTVTIEGGKELEEALNALPEIMAHSIVVPAMEDAAEHIRQAIEASARTVFQKHTGRLHRGIKVQLQVKSRGSRGVFIKAKIGMRTTPGTEFAYYARFQERGYRHVGRGAKNRNALRGGKIGGKFLKKPFMEPAFTASAPKALAILTQQIREGLDEAARRVRLKQRGMVD